ncbi:MAG TPA: DUF2270 domain-containing protein [Blastocatellia bacterium]|nr:DUF2270 domain-containing protein [Blastocatellia bacterium]
MTPEMAFEKRAELNPSPVTSAEYVNTLAHYYRGEMARMAGWRDRIDRTTNWSITVVAAMLSVSLSSPTSHHGVLIFAMLLVFLLLVIESRRYRFFDVYRHRVRMLERNYYAAIFAGDRMAEADWLRQLGNDLRMPQFYISLNQAMSRRLRRNYCWIFLILLLAWLLKTTTAVLQPKSGEAQFIHSTGELLRNASIGALPGWLVLTALLAFYGWLAYVIFRYRETEGELAYGQVHV